MKSELRNLICIFFFLQINSKEGYITKLGDIFKVSEIMILLKCDQALNFKTRGLLMQICAVVNRRINILFDTDHYCRLEL